jgi:hypothetical protein
VPRPWPMAHGREACDIVKRPGRRRPSAHTAGPVVAGPAARIQTDTRTDTNGHRRRHAPVAVLPSGMLLDDIIAGCDSAGPKRLPARPSEHPSLEGGRALRRGACVRAGAVRMCDVHVEGVGVEEQTESSSSASGALVALRCARGPRRLYFARKGPSTGSRCPWCHRRSRCHAGCSSMVFDRCK